MIEEGNKRLILDTKWCLTCCKIPHDAGDVISLALYVVCCSICRNERPSPDQPDMAALHSRELAATQRRQ
jgi:hypothetical protein